MKRQLWSFLFLIATMPAWAQAPKMHSTAKELRGFEKICPKWIKSKTDSLGAGSASLSELQTGCECLLPQLRLLEQSKPEMTADEFLDALITAATPCMEPIVQRIYQRQCETEFAPVLRQKKILPEEKIGDFCTCIATASTKVYHDISMDTANQDQTTPIGQSLVRQCESQVRKAK